MSKGEILYIEDNFHNRRIVRKILERQEYILYDAEDGLEGYNRLKELMPKVVLLDISLPTMDGIEIANKVKEDEATRDVILIALTASAMSGDRERFLEAGCDDYLSKPFRAMDLVEMVDFYMSPDFVPGKTLSPGAKLMLSKADTSKPIRNPNDLPKPDLRRKTDPLARKTTKPNPTPLPKAAPAPPKAVFAPPKAAPTPQNSGNNNREDVPQKTNNGETPKKKLMMDAKKNGSDEAFSDHLNAGINDMFDSLNPAAPNHDED